MPLSQTLHRQIDRCVMCGICSQHCPTYALSANENESPRGRLALIDAYNQGQLALSDTLQAHLDHCLGCRACERACPSQVEFGEIMDRARDLIEPRRPASLRKRLGHALLGHRRLLRAALGSLRWAQRSGIAAATGNVPPIPASPRWRSHYPPAGKARGEVALFLGCVNERLGQEELRAGIRLLNALGYGVHVPRAQTCCGALHRHNGALGQAKKLARKNLRAFAKLQVEAILHTASGCTSALREYERLLAAGTASGFGAPVEDINHFLSTRDWPAGIRLAPLPRRVAVHTPCSLKNVLRQGEAPFRLLRRIPAIDLVALPDDGYCCGGAGSYPLTQPGLAARLRENTLTALRESAAELLVTSNIGCALHLRAGLRETDGDMEVVHPLTLLARQLGGSGD